MNTPTIIKFYQRGAAIGLAVVIGFLGNLFPAGARAQSVQSVQAVDRGTEYYNSTAAADAATEKVLESLSADFLQGGETLVSNQLSYYESLYPNSNEDPYWSNYVFTSPVGGAPGIWVGKRGPTGFVPSAGMFPGSYAFTSVYRVAANARLTNNNTASLIAAVWQDVALENIPLFNFAMFYNGIMEFSDVAPMTVNGPVHCNTNIYVGTVSSSHLFFNGFVMAGGIITNPPNGGYAQSAWTGPIIYNGLPAPGWANGQPTLSLQMGTNNFVPNAVREIINPPSAGESQTNPIAAQRYYNKADMIIIISNALVGTTLITNTTSVLNTNSVTVYVKNSMFDSSPLVYAVTNGVTNGTINGINDGVAWLNWVNIGFTNWLSFTNTFTDQRQASSNHVVQIDVGKLGTWIGTTNGCTNIYLTAKWNATTPFNGIIYIQDLRTTNASWMNCVRLVNGQNITNGLYHTGLTVATQNPLYIQGFYNCPSPITNVGTTNTLGCRPFSVICDALTILSPAWSDRNSTPALSINATDDTVNTAIIAGNVPSTDTTATGFSGGVVNLPRLLEDWAANNLYLNTSLVCLYTSAQATKQFQYPGNYYLAPTRHFSFDLNYLNPAGLPPGTPTQAFVERLHWLTPPPGNDPSH